MADKMQLADRSASVTYLCEELQDVAFAFNRAANDLAARTSPFVSDRLCDDWELTAASTIQSCINYRRNRGIWHKFDGLRSAVEGLISGRIRQADLRIAVDN